MFEKLYQCTSMCIVLFEVKFSLDDDRIVYCVPSNSAMLVSLLKNILDCNNHRSKSLFSNGRFSNDSETTYYP